MRSSKRVISTLSFRGSDLSVVVKALTISNGGLGSIPALGTEAISVTSHTEES